MPKLLLLIALSLVCQLCSAQFRPFPRQMNYVGCIKPAIAQATLNADVRTFYDYWKDKYLKKSSVISTRYYIQADSTGGSASAKSNSEVINYTCNY